MFIICCEQLLHFYNIRFDEQTSCYKKPFNQDIGKTLSPPTRNHQFRFASSNTNFVADLQSFSTLQIRSPNRLYEKDLSGITRAQLLGNYTEALHLMSSGSKIARHWQQALTVSPLHLPKVDRRRPVERREWTSQS